MKRVGLGALLILACTTVAAQTTNCMMLAGGVVQCSQPQGIGPTTPSTNCFVSNGMIRCSQPQGLQPPPPTLAPTPSPPIQPVLLPSPRNIGTGENEKTQMEMKQLLELLQEQNAAIQSDLSKPEPDDITLKAGYCVGVIQHSIDEILSLSSGLARSNRFSVEQNKVLESARAASSAMVASQMTLLNKAKSYVYPQIPNLDPSPLLAARKQGYLDGAQASAELKPCEDQCGANSLQCLDRCEAKSATYQRSKICNDLSFLP